MRDPGRLGQVGVNAGRGNVAMPEHQLHHFGLYTVFEQPCRMDVVEPIPAAWAAPAKVRLSVPRPTGLVAARVVNSQRGFLWVSSGYRRAPLSRFERGRIMRSLCSASLQHLDGVIDVALLEVKYFHQ